MTRLPELDVHLREWSAMDFEQIKSETKKVMTSTKGMGNGSDSFKEACLKFMRLMLSGNSGEISDNIIKPVDVRALTFLLLNAKEFDSFDVDADLLDRLLLPRNPVSRLSLLNLIELFFRWFDEHLDTGCFSAFLKSQIESYGMGESDLNRLCKNSHLLFDSKGPTNVVSSAIENKEDLNVCFRRLGLEGFGEGRFQDLCRYIYYLETLKKIPVGEYDPVLEEVCKEDVYLSPGTKDGLLGHEVLSILIDRADSLEISDQWQRVLLTIAGDPRVPESTSQYQQWWALLGSDRVAKVKGWLSRFDLELFLKVLESYGSNSGNEDLKRMFPSRKHFLEGLLEQGVAVNSRLFLTRDADDFVKRNYKKNEVPNYARVEDGDASMIYIQVDKLHLIEGTHNFKLWVFPVLPIKSQILDYSRNAFARDELSGRLSLMYRREVDVAEYPEAAIVHSPFNFNWQHKAIEYLQSYGVNLDLEILFSKNDYALYKRRYGLSTMPSRAKSIPALGQVEAPSSFKKSVVNNENQVQMKVCKKCFEPKEVDNFFTSKKSFDGYTKWCRECLTSAI